MPEKFYYKVHIDLVQTPPSTRVWWVEAPTIAALIAEISNYISCTARPSESHFLGFVVSELERYRNCPVPFKGALQSRTVERTPLGTLVGIDEAILKADLTNPEVLAFCEASEKDPFTIRFYKYEPCPKTAALKAAKAELSTERQDNRISLF